MAGERYGNDRRSMTISVTLLAVTLSVVFMAYYAFSENNIESHVQTIKFATIVSYLNYMY